MLPPRIIHPSAGPKLPPAICPRRPYLRGQICPPDSICGPRPSPPAVRPAATAALFDIGRFAIGFYIGKQGLESAYGASSSVVVLLIWVYYSAQIVLFGAEFTHARSQQTRAA